METHFCSHVNLLQRQVREKHDASIYIRGGELVDGSVATRQQLFCT